MEGTKYLIEKGGERKYVDQAELAALTKDGWIVLGQLIPAIGARVPQTSVPAETPKPKGKGARKDESESESVG